MTSAHDRALRSLAQPPLRAYHDPEGGRSRTNFGPLARRTPTSAPICRGAHPAWLLAGARDRPGQIVPHGSAGADSGRRADLDRSATAGSGRPWSQRRFLGRGARKRARAACCDLPVPRARPAAGIPRSRSSDARRRAAVRHAASLSRPLLALDARGPRRRPCPARRRQRRAPPAATRRLRGSDGAGRPAAVGDLRPAGGGLFAGLRPDRADQFRFRRTGRGRRLRSRDGGAGARRAAARPAPCGGIRAGGHRRRRMGLRFGARGLPSTAQRQGPAGAGSDRRPRPLPAGAPANSPRATGRAG